MKYRPRMKTFGVFRFSPEILIFSDLLKTIFWLRKSENFCKCTKCVKLLDLIDDFLQSTILSRFKNLLSLRRRRVSKVHERVGNETTSRVQFHPEFLLTTGALAHSLSPPGKRKETAVTQANIYLTTHSAVDWIYHNLSSIFDNFFFGTMFSQKEVCTCSRGNQVTQIRQPFR